MTGIISKWLARIEHKLDLLLESRAQHDPFLELRPFGDKEHLCSVCRAPVSYYVDMNDRQIVRRCGCDLGLQVPVDFSHLEQVTNPTPTNQGIQHGEDAEDPENPRG